MSQTVILETKNLTHIFPDGTCGFENINLKIYDSEFIVIAGANGSGKTVLTRHLNGLLTPTQGEVLMYDEPIHKNIIQVRKKIGLIFQDSESQFVGQTVYEEVAFGPENLNLPREEIKKIVEASLETVGLKGLETYHPYTLSGGQKRKLAIAGVLAMKPQIIIFDEPFTGLDYPSVVQVLKELVKLHQIGHTIILITHELEKVLAHASRLIIIHNGSLVKEGIPKAVIADVECYGVRMPLKEGEGIDSLTWLK